MAETALGDPAIYTNPRTVTVLDALALLDLAW
jgi:alcohol dehydrogenase class IV